MFDQCFWYVIVNYGRTPCTTEGCPMLSGEIFYSIYRKGYSLLWLYKGILSSFLSLPFTNLTIFIWVSVYVWSISYNTFLSKYYKQDLDNQISICLSERKTKSSTLSGPQIPHYILYVLFENTYIYVHSDSYVVVTKFICTFALTFVW